MAQAVQHLPHKIEALSENPSSQKKKKQEYKRYRKPIIISLNVYALRRNTISQA
jgi:hypothetical protein